MPGLLILLMIAILMAIGGVAAWIISLVFTASFWVGGVVFWVAAVLCIGAVGLAMDLIDHCLS